MGIAQRIHDTVEGWQDEWKDRLRGWMASWVEGGVTRVMDFLEPDLRAEVKPSLLRLREIPGMPADFTDLIDKTLEEPKAIHLAAILPYLVGIMIGFGMGAAAPASRIGSYQVDNLVHSYRVDPMSAITAWRRDPVKYAKLLDDLKDLGWSDDRIEALKFYTLFIPSADEQTLWLAREVYEKVMIDRYGLDAELPNYEETDFSKVGVDPEQMKNKWAAHWEHASFMQVIEMLHRGTLSLDKTMPAPPTTKEGWAARDAEGEEALYDWYRLVEIPPFWRDRLTAMSWNVPTRVDVRRWYDMRTIDEAELYNVYHRQGYRGKDLDNYVLWTKVYVAFPDLMARWTKGWITLDEVKAELTGLGMPAARVEEFIQMKVKAEQPERTAAERDITRTDIIKGVKTGVITRDEGEELLSDLGYDEDEAIFILDINIPVDEEDVVVKQRELTKADILKGLKTEVITEAEAIDKIVGLRYKQEDALFLIKIFNALIKPPTEPREREASKADIIAAVKMGLITPEDAYLMLQDIGFTPEASEFILAVRAETSPFSPINFAEFKDLTQKYRIAIGKEARPMTEELKAAADEVVKLTGEVESLARSVEKEKRKLIKEEVVPEDQTKMLTGLQVKLHRTESELARAKTEYSSKLAEWRHGE